MEVIFKKPPRLQRIMFDVMQYSPEILYKKGKDIPLADALSRDCAVDRDLKMTKLENVIMKGWPEKIRSLDPELRKYWNFREELSAYNELLFKGNRVIIPKSEQPNILQQIHYGHIGIGISIRRAKEIVYWYGMTKDITNIIERCSVCQKTQSKPPREPIISKEVPTLTWEICGSDLFTYHGVDYLILCDSYSGFFELEGMKNGTESAQAITILKRWFVVHGIPRIF